MRGTGLKSLRDYQLLSFVPTIWTACWLTSFRSAHDIYTAYIIDGQFYQCVGLVDFPSKSCTRYTKKGGMVARRLVESVSAYKSARLQRYDV